MRRAPAPLAPPGRGRAGRSARWTHACVGWSSALLIALWGCAPEPRTPGIEGVEARLVVDRALAYVGDPIGVTVEVDLPEGYAAAEALPLDNEAFMTERLEAGVPVPLSWGTRYVWSWTLRPRVPGAQALPELRLPIRGPEGDDAPVVLGRMPLRVRSVRAELSERDALFDIRPAPARGFWTTGTVLAAVLGGGLLVALLWLQRHQGPPAASPGQLARDALAGLAELPRDSARERAQLAIGLIWRYVGARFGLEREGRTAAELANEIDAPLPDILRDLEHTRFARAPASEEIERQVRALQEYWEHALGA